MGEKTLSIFVDESGNFGYPDKVSRYYVIGLVLHDQDAQVQPAVDGLDLTLRDMQISHHCFHAGPMIRREKGYEFMDAGFRRRIFAAMMAFARKVEFRYFCLTVAEGRVAFAQGVDPAKYKLFQVADLICTVKLLELKLRNGELLTESEQRFFGGPRDFKRNVLRKIKAKEIL